jgi:eukaryotic-like serine/threonine-protein kinase
MPAETCDALCEQDEYLGEVICGYLKAVQAGQSPDRQELLSRHPSLAVELGEFFYDRDRLERLAAPLRQVAKRAPSLVGSAMCGYEILEEIGRGGMGVVFAARQQRPRRVVALKMILAGVWANREHIQRFRRESEILAGLRHPNIVQVHEVGEYEDRPYFTMDYAEGGSLARKLAASAPLSARAAAELVRALALAVHSAHEQGIVHRDLKPSNILLSADGSPLISDFGLAKQVADGLAETPCAEATRTGAILGTPSYMAPEQALRQGREIGAPADVYALGAILYECLTGRPPFKGVTALDTLEQARTQEPVPPSRLQPGLQRDLQTICLKCLNKLPIGRYGSAKALAEDLQRFLAGKPIVARPVRAWERTWKWARRQPAAAALIVLVVLAVVGAIGGVLVYNAQLKQAAAEARQGRELADERYKSARDSLGRILNRLKDPKLADIPRLQELRQKTLEDALAFYQSALEQLDADPVVRRDAAFAYAETGAIQFVLGQGVSACEHFRNAIELIEGLPPEYRDSQECRGMLTVCHGHLGARANALAKYEEAEQHFLAERALCEQLARDEPDNAGRKNELARAEHHLGRVFLESGRLQQALEHYLQSVKIRTSLVREHSSVHEYQVQLAESWINLGVVHGSLGRMSEARASQEKASALLQPLVERYPQNLEWKTSLAAVYSNMSNHLRSEGKISEALKPLDRAVALSEAALEQEPRHMIAGATALNAHGARAQIHEGLKDWAAAVKDWDRVMALDRSPKSWLWQLFRALDISRTGEHSRAVAEARLLLKDPKLPNEGVFALARLYALSSESARTDVSLSAAKQHLFAEGYALQALALLRKLQAHGFFENRDNVKELATDPEFGALRGRDDFQQLLKQVEAGKKK